MSSLNNILGQSENCTDENAINISFQVNQEMEVDIVVTVTEEEKDEIAELNLLLKETPEIHHVVAENEGVVQAQADQDQLNEYPQEGLIFKTVRELIKERFMSENRKATDELQRLTNELAAAQQKYINKVEIKSKMKMNTVVTNEIVLQQRRTNGKLISEILKSRSNPSYYEKLSKKKAFADFLMDNVDRNNCKLLDLNKKLVTLILQKYQVLTESNAQLFLVEKRFLELLHDTSQEVGCQNVVLEEIKEYCEGVAK